MGLSSWLPVVGSSPRPSSLHLCCHTAFFTVCAWALAHPNPGWLHLNLLSLQRPYFKIKLCSKAPKSRTWAYLLWRHNPTHDALQEALGTGEELLGAKACRGTARAALGLGWDPHRRHMEMEYGSEGHPHTHKSVGSSHLNQQNRGYATQKPATRQLCCSSPTECAAGHRTDGMGEGRRRPRPPPATGVHQQKALAARGERCGLKSSLETWCLEGLHLSYWSETF